MIVTSCFGHEGKVLGELWRQSLWTIPHPTFHASPSHSTSTTSSTSSTCIGAFVAQYVTGNSHPIERRNNIKKLSIIGNRFAKIVIVTSRMKTPFSKYVILQ